MGDSFSCSSKANQHPEINLEAKSSDLKETQMPMFESHDHDVPIGRQDELKRRLVAQSPSFWEMFQSCDLDVLIQQLDELQVCDEKESTQRNKWSPLHIATVRSSVRKIKKLIEAGTNPDARWDGTGNTPLHLACRAQNIGCASMLISVPSPYKVNSRLRILTALIDLNIDSRMLPKDVAKMIVDYLAIPGADWALKNSANKTPLDLLKSEWDVSQLQMDITKTLNRWNRGGKEELELFLPRY